VVHDTPRTWDVYSLVTREVTVLSTIVTFGVERAFARSLEMKRPWWKERPSGGAEGFEEIRLFGYGMWTGSL
jgi:hypothetical protein